MLSKRMLAVGLAAIAAIFSAWTILAAPPPDGPGGHGDEDTLALAPISLGNPALAAALATFPDFTPDGEENEPFTLRPYNRVLAVKSGDSLNLVLARAGVEPGQARAAVAALKGTFDARRIKRGQQIAVSFTPPPLDENATGLSPGRFLGFSFEPDAATRITVARSEKGFEAGREKKKLTRTLARASGTIDRSLYVNGRQAGLPARVLVALIRAYSWDVDFQRDIWAGDSFEVLFERFTDKAGNMANTGRVVYAALTLSGKRHPIYLHTDGRGDADYFDDRGQSARKALMRTPIDGARLSSRYGKRRHPVLGYTKMHRGVDFAAPRGTPIYAAGSGRVDYAGRNGGYGKYVRIRHNARYATAYAHMKAIKRGVAKGTRVRQGQVIGYVGTTGRSTGPHLHYEIMEGKRQVNPLKVKMPSGRKLKGGELARFQKSRADIDRAFVRLEGVGKVASADEPDRAVTR